MKNEQEIREEIEKVKEKYGHVLNCGPASLLVNGVRAIMQIEAKAIITGLYYVLGEKRPKFECDDFEKMDQ